MEFSEMGEDKTHGHKKRYTTSHHCRGRSTGKVFKMSPGMDVRAANRNK